MEVAQASKGTGPKRTPALWRRLFSLKSFQDEDHLHLHPVGIDLVILN
jgi:hypothetical protein